MELNATIARVQQAHAESIRRLFDGRPLDRVPSICRIDQCEYLSATPAAFDPWLKASIASIEQHVELAEHEVTFHPLLIEFWPLGVHFVDALFGARVYETGDNFWNDQLPGELGDVEAPDLDAAPLVRWALASIERTLAAVPEGVSVATPVFSSPLNIALNLFSERCLTALASPGRSDRRGLQVIAEAIRGLHLLIARRFPGRVRFYAASHRWAPPGFGHICGCSTQLVGPDAYARHIAPLDDAILRTYPEGGTIHLCGRHPQHIPCWRRMQSLRGVQLNDVAADDFEAYFTGLRSDQVIYIGPTPLMTIDRIMQISRGRRVILQARLEDYPQIDAGGSRIVP